MTDKPQGRRRTRPLTEAEAAHLRTLGAQVQAAKQTWQSAIAARNAELRRLYADGASPAAMGELLPPDRGDAEHMQRVSVATIVAQPR